MAQETVAPKHHPLLLPAFIGVLMVVFVYSSMFRAQLLNFDDRSYITDNEAIHHINATSIGKLFYEPSCDLYIPLTFLTYMGEYALAGENPGMYHATNILLHLLNSLLLLWLVWLLTKNKLAAVGMAGLFALHPTHVESVAWVAERKDVLYALFYISACIAYYYYSQSNKLKYYVLCIGLFVLSCLAKPMAITLPAVLLLYDYFFLKKHSWKILLNKIPFALLSIVFVFLAFQFMDVVKKYEFSKTYNLFDRAIMLLYALFFYVQKTLLPVSLSSVYYYPEKTDGWLPLYNLAGACTFVAITAWVFVSKRSNHFIKACYLFYVVTVFPVLQIFPNTNTVTADRYTYLPALGIYALLLYVLIEAVRKNKLSARGSWVLLTLLLITLGAAAKTRTAVWADSYSFYTNALNDGGTNPNLMCELSDMQIERGEMLQAYQLLHQADSLYPDTKNIKNRYAWILCANGNYAEGIIQYERCIAINAALIGTYANLGDAYVRTNQPLRAVLVYKQGLAAYHDDNALLYNMGYAYWQAAMSDSAAAYFRQTAHKGFEPGINFMRNHNLPLNP